MKFLRLTDLHLNFLKKEELLKFYNDLNQFDCDGIFITGDTSTGSQLIKHISALAKNVNKTIYFVLGNHDFYHSSFKETEKNICKLTDFHSNLKYLTKKKVIQLTTKTALIGHAGWHDGRWGTPLSMIFAADWYYIQDFRLLYSFKDCMALDKKRADKSALIIQKRLTNALINFDVVYLLTHFPPWPEKPSSIWKKMTQKAWTPYNTSKIMAETLENIMNKFPEKQLIVLAGHTHHKRNDKITNNITSKVGEASFGKVYINDLHEIE